MKSVKVLLSKSFLSILCALVFADCSNNQSEKESTEASNDSSANSSKSIIVTAENFPRAESDMYFANALKMPGAGLGKLTHQREIVSVDNQPVIRYNRDVLVSSGVFDLEAGHIIITMPDPGKRFQSIL